MKWSLTIGGFVFLGALLILAPISPDIVPGRPALEAPQTATILFAGDTFFDRYIRRVGETVGWDYPFSCIDRVLFGADTVIVNLEGPITNEPSVSVGTSVGEEGHFTFTFPPEVASYLKRHNIGVVNLGNNHIFNFGYSGVRKTVETLDEAGILHVGAPRLAYSSRDMREDVGLSSVSTTVNGISLTFVSYNEFDPEGWRVSKERALASLASAREAGSVPILYAHWGEEYQPPSEGMYALAREFVDHGASLVVGSHPHIVLPREPYKDAFIYYSLGNFIFDQYFNDDVRHGLLIKVLFSDSGVQGVEEIPIVLETDGRTCVSGDAPPTFPPAPIPTEAAAVY